MKTIFFLHYILIFVNIYNSEWRILTLKNALIYYRRSFGCMLRDSVTLEGKLLTLS